MLNSRSSSERSAGSPSGAEQLIGFLILMIPYVGTLVLLPLIVTYRYLSLEFLAQFDSRLDVFRPMTPATTAQG